MFPLSAVLFPRGALPLHIFEPRYLAMVGDAIDDDGTFGVVLIERGSEVGGGDVRFDVGTVAQIVNAGFIDDERMAVMAVGSQRIRIDEWVSENPYPQAIVSDHPQRAAVGDLGRPVDAAWRSWRRLAALASELGANVGAGDMELPDDAVDALWTLCALAPLEQIDRQRLLELSDPVERANRLCSGLDERALMLEARLAGDI
jgi:Lon protease-like protein